MNVEFDIVGHSVDGRTLHSVPDENRDIREIIDFESEAFKKILGVSIYQRLPEDCPWARGNWMIDIQLSNGTRIGQVFCLRLPLEMEEEAVVRFAKPLLDKIKNVQISGRLQ